MMKVMKDLKAIAARCLHCPNPRCQGFCPCGNHIPDVLDKIKAGDEEAAARILFETNPFPELTSLLCDHARQCRGHCVLGIRGEPVDFPSVEEALAPRVHALEFQGESNGKSVAIVGAGPSALSAATFLIRAGFAVKIYEKERSLGGAILTGIPYFRFDKTPLASIQRRIESMGGEFIFNTKVDADLLDAIREENDFVLLALGAEKENVLSIPNMPEGVYQALPLLREYNFDERQADFAGKYVFVMGGGNVAMDVSRMLKRTGAKVTLIYRRDEASMPAQRVEIEEAKADGVFFMPLTNVADWITDGKKLTGLKLVKMQLGEKDESGRPSFSTIEGSEFPLSCDAFVMAIGEKSSLGSLVGEEELGLEKGLLAMGDCKYGAKNIAAAVKDGRETAALIIEYLSK